MVRLDSLKHLRAGVGHKWGVFPTVICAVRCGAEVQTSLTSHNTTQHITCGLYRPKDRINGLLELVINGFIIVSEATFISRARMYIDDRTSRAHICIQPQCSENSMIQHRPNANSSGCHTATYKVLVAYWVITRDGGGDCRYQSQKKRRENRKKWIYRSTLDMYNIHCIYQIRVNDCSRCSVQPLACSLQLSYFLLT